MGLASELVQKVSLGKDVVSQSIGAGSEFVRKNPVTSAVGVAGGVLAGGTIIQIARKKRKAGRKTKAKRKAVRRPTKKKTKTQIRAMRLRNLSKARRIKRGRGLGRGEIKHSGKGTKGTKRVSFITKGGKRVSFKIKGTSKRRKGFRK